MDGTENADGLPMRCEEAQEILWPQEGPQGETPELARARAHLRACSRCRLFFERDRVIGELLKRVRGDEGAPDPLRERIYESLALDELESAEAAERVAASDRRWRRIGWSVALPLAAAAVLILGLTLGSGPDPRPPHVTRTAHFANDYLRLAVQREVVDRRVDSAGVSALFERELGLSVAPVSVPGATVTRAMVCFLGGRRGALVEYDVAGARLAHYRIPLADGAGERSGSLELSEEMGLPVARWIDDRYEHALVGELSTSELEELARERFEAR